MKEFSYLNYFSDKIKDIKLRETIVKPQKVVLSKYVTCPGTLVGNPGRATMLSEYGESVLILDFEKEIVGTVTLDILVKGNSAIQLYYGEDYEEVLGSYEYDSNWYKRPTDEIELREGEYRITNYGRRAFRFIRVVIPEGYNNVEISNISATLVHYNLIQKGNYSCSDLELNSIWDISVNTTKLCMQNFYEDGVKRDGLLWIGDFRIQFLCNCYCFGDIELARKSIYMIASTQRADGALPACAGKGGGHQHPEGIEYMPGVPHGTVDEWIILNYNTDFINIIKEYFYFSGDRALLEDVWPFVVRTLKYLCKTVDFKKPTLFEKSLGSSQGAKPEDVSILTDALDCFEGGWASNGTFLLQLYWAFSDALLLSEVMGDEITSSLCADYLKVLNDEVKCNYYMPVKKIFCNYPLAQGSNLGLNSWHPNIFAVLSGFVNIEEGADLLSQFSEFIFSLKPNLGFVRGWMNDALFKSGREKEALTDIKEQWGRMLREGYSTCWERMDAKEFNHQYKLAPASYCHGWSASPAYLLPMYVLGVKPIVPGFKNVLIEPKLGDLEWAEGSIPTPYGEIFVRWETKPEIKGCVILPKGITGDVVLKVEGSRKSIALKEGVNLFNRGV